MSMEKHDDNCPGCQPALVDLRTKRPLPPDSPEMQAVNRVWAQTNLIERRAWHAVTCQNSRSPSDLRLAEGIAKRMQEALKEVKPQ